MQYEKEIILKDGAKCLLRGAGEADAAEVLRTFDLTHAETDYFLTYPEENSFTVQEEAKFLKARSESKNAIEIAAFVDARIAGTAGTDPIDDKEKIRHRADFGIAIEKGFQPGRKVLEEKGARVESLAIIEKMGNGTITFKEQDD